MTLRDHRLTLKHAYYDPADVTDVTAAVRSAVAEINPWLFVCGDAGIDARLRRGFPFYLARKARHSAIYATKTLPRCLGPGHSREVETVFSPEVDGGE